MVKTHKELDLTVQKDVDAFFAQEKIDQVYLAAAKVGGIYANNTFPAEFIYQNLMIESKYYSFSSQRPRVKNYFFGLEAVFILNSQSSR
ncbi:MAG: NAD-dependent epimerase/dehydratase family protein [Escherichia coli]